MSGLSNVASKLGAMPAFPFETSTTIDYGLTKREWLVGMALQGLCCQNQWNERERAMLAVSLADAVLAELEKQQ